MKFNGEFEQLRDTVKNFLGDAIMRGQKNVEIEIETLTKLWVLIENLKAQITE